MVKNLVKIHKTGYASKISELFFPCGLPAYHGPAHYTLLPSYSFSMNPIKHIIMSVFGIWIYFQVIISWRCISFFNGEGAIV